MNPKVLLRDVISFLNERSAEAYARDGENSPYGWAYSLAAIRLGAAEWQGEFNSESEG